MKTRNQLETEIMLDTRLDEEREKSDNRYAIKLIERIVFTLLTLAFLGAVGFVIRLMLTKHP